MAKESIQKVAKTGTFSGTTSTVGYLSINNIPSGYLLVYCVCDDTNFVTLMTNNNRVQVRRYDNSVIANQTVSVRWVAVKN